MNNLEQFEPTPQPTATSLLLERDEMLARISAAFILPSHLVTNGEGMPMPTATQLLGWHAVALSRLMRPA